MVYEWWWNKRQFLWHCNPIQSNLYIFMIQYAKSSTIALFISLLSIESVNQSNCKLQPISIDGKDRQTDDTIDAENLPFWNCQDTKKSRKKCIVATGHFHMAAPLNFRFACSKTTKIHLIFSMFDRIFVFFLSKWTKSTHRSNLMDTKMQDHYMSRQISVIRASLVWPSFLFFADSKFQKMFFCLFLNSTKKFIERKTDEQKENFFFLVAAKV